ncbi:uncharacterized protein LOC107037305 [Diachasma alloeum]|uniref:uncharacterized protein LOC107037305 n=1 Tax=Diachasma alloeum TaxID=454923 RepID=UPI0007381807|nr:uncharacterized protein LOC107037305 [Diachasma alloeum]
MPKAKAEPEESAMGFKDKQKALDTLKVLDGRDISYQYNVISGFVRRGKRVLEITKDGEKLAKIREALEVFNEWLEDYKKKGRSKENFNYLSLEIVEAYKALAESYGILNEDFLKAYREEKGDYKPLREVKTPAGEVTWDIERNRKLKEIVSKMKSSYIPWYKVDDGVYRGLPSEEHVKCILLGYSPEPTKLKKLISQVVETCRDEEKSRDAIDSESGSRICERSSKRRSDGSSLGGSSDSEVENKQKKRKSLEKTNGGSD